MGRGIRQLGVAGLGLAVALGCGASRYVPPPSPSVFTVGADGLTAHGALLHGQVTSNGTSGSVSFRFGGDPALGLSSGQWPYLVLPGVGLESPVSYPSGGSATRFQSTLSGLVPGWTYSYQAVAQTNDYQTVLGQIATFTTPLAAESSWIRVLLPGGSPALVGLGSGFAVRGGTGGAPTWTVAFDGNGSLQWQRLGTSGDGMTPQAQVSDSGFLTVSRVRKATSPTTADWNSEVQRVDGAGAVTWQRSLPQWLGTGAPLADGGAQVLGDLGQGLVWVRLTPSGDIAWAAANDSGTDPLTLLELAGGTVAYVGRSVRLAGSHDGIPVEVRAANGTLAWRRVLWRADGEHAEAAEPAVGGGLVLAGYTFAGPLQEPLVVRLAADGAVLWSVKLAGEVGTATGLAPAGDGGWLVCGAGNLGNMDTRYAWVAKLDAAGQSLWATRFSGKFQAPVRVLARPGGGFVLATQVEAGYNVYGVGVILADGTRRAGGMGTDATLAATAVSLTTELPTWADRAVAFPRFTAGGAPLVSTNLTAVQLVP